MKKVVLVSGVLVLLFVQAGYGERLAVLSEFKEPHSLVAAGEWIYVTEGTTIFVYSGKDFTLKKKFGREGEGPEAFLNFAVATPRKDQLLISSPGKISYYSKDGNFKKELQAGEENRGALFFPLEKGFVTPEVIEEENQQYITIKFYDEKLAQPKEIYRMKMPVQQSDKIEYLKRAFAYQAHDNLIYVIGKEGFFMEVLDHTGRLLFSIRQQDYERRKFTDQDEKTYREAFKLLAGDQYELVKDRLVFPDYFPEIASFFVADDKIYIATWKRGNGKVEFFIYDAGGRLLKQTFVPMVFKNVIQPYPAAVKAGTLIQLIANQAGEWELHATPIE